MESIAIILKAKREASGLSADEVGRLINRDRIMVYKYEKGQAQPSTEVLKAFIKLGWLHPAEAFQMDDLDRYV